MLIKRNESGKHPIIVTDYQPCSDQKTFQFDYWPLLIIFQEWTREALLAIKAYLEKRLIWSGMWTWIQVLKKYDFIPFFQYLGA